MRKIICDRCGANITAAEKTGHISMNWRAARRGDPVPKNPYKDCDFCQACMEDIAKVIDFKIVPAREETDSGNTREEGRSIPVEPDDEEEIEVVERIKGNPKRKIDKGKVGALAKAGWSNKDIASEMGVTAERVRQILKEMG